MKIKSILLATALLLFSYACIGQKTKGKTVTTKKEISTVWNEFLNTINNHNIDRFKEMSNTHIRCYLCLENTKAEQKEINKLRDTDTLWYNKIYDQMIYISIDNFIKDDFDILFSQEFVKTLNKKATKFYQKEIEADGIEYFGVLVTTTERSKEHEGGQHSFEFVKINGIWKFNDIGTIP